MNNFPTFEDFRSQALARGFDEVLERVWNPGTVLGTHTHEYEVDAMVIRGEMWLGEDGAERRLVPGDTFNVAAGTPHSERYGDEGATLWAARRR